MNVLEINKEARTVVVEIDGRKRTLPITFMNEERIHVEGIAVKYRTGAKVWKGEFTYWFKSGNVNGVHTNMEHRARRVSLDVVGFYEDYSDYKHSHHSGQSTNPLPTAIGSNCEHAKDGGCGWPDMCDTCKAANKLL